MVCVDESGLNHGCENVSECGANKTAKNSKQARKARRAKSAKNLGKREG